jgi:hypothetical protein
MPPLLLEAARIWRATSVGDRARLIGGLAVRQLAPSGSRLTADIDLVCMDAGARAEVRRHLESIGYRVGDLAGWMRAVDPSGRMPVVDVAPHPIVAPRTFDAVHLRSPATTVEVDGVPVSIAGKGDLVVLKLLAHRAQDLVDLLVLAGSLGIETTPVVRTAEEDDVERALSRGALLARHTLRTGELSEAFEQSTGVAPSQHAVDALARFLAQLEVSGI